MDFYNKSEIITLYESYNFKVSGITQIYHSHVFNEDNDIVSTIIITDIQTNKEIFNRNLENNFVKRTIFDKCIDNILFYFSRNTLDSYSIDKTINDVLVQNNGNIFCHRMDQIKDKEKQEAENNKRIAEREAIENEQRKEIQNYCNKKKLYCKFTYSDLYVFKINKDAEKVTELLNNADSNRLEMYVEYARNYPSNELTLVYIGNKELDKMLTELKQVA